MSLESILGGSIRRSKLLQQKQLFYLELLFRELLPFVWNIYFLLSAACKIASFEILVMSGNIYTNRRFWLFLKELNCYSDLQILLVFFMIDHLSFLSFRQSHDYLLYTYFFLLMQSFHVMRVVEFAVTCQHYQIFRL